MDSSRARFKKSLSASSHSEEDDVEEWLSKNEDQAEAIVERWLCSHPQSAKNLYIKYGHFVGMDAMVPFSSVQKSKSMRNYISTPAIQKHQRKRRMSELRKLEKQQLFVELLKDVVSPDVDVNHLSHKILVNVLLLTKADRSSLFLVEGTGEDQVLVSRLFDVTEGISVTDAVHDEADAIKMALGVGVAGHVAESGEKINLENAYDDPRFNPAVDIATGYLTKSILCMPIKTADGQVIGVAQVINKTEGDVFTAEDEEDFQMYLNFCAIGLMNAQLFDHSFALSRRLQVLLHLARGLFEDTTKLEVVINKMMQQSMELIPCVCCAVLLLDTDNKDDVHFSQTFQIDHTTVTSESMVSIRSGRPEEISDLDIANHVATTATPVIMSSVAQSGQHHDSSSEHLTLSQGTKSILCIPIFDKNGQVLGIVKLTNKLNHPCFSQSDMESLEVFATFCGLGIHNVMMYESIAVTDARKKVAFDILSYHASSSISDVKRLQQIPIPKSSDYQLTSFMFDDISLSEDHTVLASVRMFIDCGIVESFRINTKVLYRWVLTVKKNYRPVTYHNWRHAFNVAQTMFAMFEEGGLASKLTKLEQLALLIGCLCHDLDHRGTNNAFQVKSQSVLAQLYTTSTMEHHHFDHCIMILNSEGNQILNGLTPPKYATVLKMLESSILSTDLALYFKRRDDFKQCVQSESFAWDEEKGRDTLRGMMMTACDVAAICKPWKIQKRVANMVANEFFEQGDMERMDLQVEPIAMMDRRKKDELPKMQVGFIDFVCMPLYDVLTNLVPDLRPLLDGVTSNRDNWQTLVDDPKAALGDPDPPDDTSVHLSAPSSVSVQPNTIEPSQPAEIGATSSNSTDTLSTTGTVPTTDVATTTMVISTKENRSEVHTSNFANGPVEGWRNSTGSSDEAHQVDTPTHKRKGKGKGHVGTHAEVASGRKHLKKCTTS